MKVNGHEVRAVRNTTQKTGVAEIQDLTISKVLIFVLSS